jgi:hypothetical protein
MTIPDKKFYFSHQLKMKSYNEGDLFKGVKDV